MKSNEIFPKLVLRATFLLFVQVFVHAGTYRSGPDKKVTGWSVILAFQALRPIGNNTNDPCELSRAGGVALGPYGGL